MDNIVGMGALTKAWNDGSSDCLYLNWADGADTTVMVTSDANNTGAERYVDITLTTTAGTPTCSAVVRIVQSANEQVYTLLGVKVNGEFKLLGETNRILGK